MTTKTRSARSKPKAPTLSSALPPSATASKRTELEIDGKKLTVSSLDKVLYPAVGVTKGQVIDYYIRISPVLLPHLQDRLLTLKRYPDGVNGGFFYEKRCPPYRPAWIKTASMWSERNKEDIHFCVASNLASLVWAANLADLELHTYLCRINHVESPTMVVFDLDPGPPADIVQCCQVAQIVRTLLDGWKLVSFPKTSGSKGLQLYIPLNLKTGFEATKTFARSLAERLASEHPDLIVSKMDKSLRTGKVLIDWSQNDQHKTTVCAYSLRAKERPTVSTPVGWEEVEKALKRKDPGLLTFTSDQVLERVEKLGDLFAPVLTLKQRLPKL